MHNCLNNLATAKWRVPDLLWLSNAITSDFLATSIVSSEAYLNVELCIESKRAFNGFTEAEVREAAENRQGQEEAFSNGGMTMTP